MSYSFKPSDSITVMPRQRWNRIYVELTRLERHGLVFESPDFSYSHNKIFYMNEHEFRIILFEPGSDPTSIEWVSFESYREGTGFEILTFEKWFNSLTDEKLKKAIAFNLDMWL